MAAAPRLDLFNDSLERCAASEGFLDRFYALFLASDPEVAEKFVGTDQRRQNKMLRRSFYLIMLSSQDEQSASADLLKIAQRHDRGNLDISPRLYELWLECLLQAAEEHDAKFDARTRDAWVQTMRVGIDVLIAAY